VTDGAEKLNGLALEGEKVFEKLSLMHGKEKFKLKLI
jgi:hypothetical protein